MCSVLHDAFRTLNFASHRPAERVARRVERANVVRWGEETIEKTSIDSVGSSRATSVV